MSDASNAIRDLMVVLETAESHVAGVVGLTLGFSDGLNLRLRAAERAEELVIRSGYSELEMTAGRASGATTEELLAYVFGAPAAAGAPATSSSAEHGLVELEADSLEPVEVEPVDIDPVELEPVEVEPVDIDPVELEPVEVEPVDIEPVELEPVDVEPVELAPVDVEPLELEPLEEGPAELGVGDLVQLGDDFGEEDDEEGDETQVFERHQGAIPVGFDDDDDDESTLVMGAEDARALMASIQEDHFDLVAPEEIEEDLDEPATAEELTPDEDTDESPMEKFYEQHAASAPPQIKTADDRPASAAIQIGEGGGARVLAPEEDEEIEVEAAPDEDDHDFDSEGGFALALEDDEYEEYEEEDEDEDEEEPEPEAPEMPLPPPAPIPEGPSQEVIQAFVAQAQRELEEGSMEEAARYYSDALDGDPKNGDLRLARGRLYMDMGDYSRAVSDFLCGEEVMPRSADPQVLMGELYSHRKDYAKAVGYLDLALRLDNRHPMAYYRRGLCYYQTKDFKKAVDDLGRARALDEDLPSINHFLSSAMKKARKGR